MSSTVLLSKGAGQIYIMAVTTEGRGVDDDLPPYTQAWFILAGKLTIGDPLNHLIDDSPASLQGFLSTHEGRLPTCLRGGGMRRHGRAGRARGGADAHRDSGSEKHFSSGIRVGPGGGCHVGLAGGFAGHGRSGDLDFGDPGFRVLTGISIRVLRIRVSVSDLAGLVAGDSDRADARPGLPVSMNGDGAAMPLSRRSCASRSA